MIRELELLESLTHIDLQRVTAASSDGTPSQVLVPDTNQGLDEHEGEPVVPDADGTKSAYTAELEFRLQRANSRVRMLIRNIYQTANPDDQEIADVVNGFQTTLAAMSNSEAAAYLYRNFTPDYFNDPDLPNEMGSAIKETLRAYCKAQGLPLLYSIWGDA